MISLTPETLRLLEDRMEANAISTPDELVRMALMAFDEQQGELIEESDPETEAAIDRGIAQADRGEFRSWEDVREELRLRYLNK